MTATIMKITGDFTVSLCHGITKEHGLESYIVTISLYTSYKRV